MSSIYISRTGPPHGSGGSSKKREGVSELRQHIASESGIKRIMVWWRWNVTGVVIIEMLNGAKNPSESHFYGSFLPGRNQFTQR
jgi:hypothetical protein